MLRLPTWSLRCVCFERHPFPQQRSSPPRGHLPSVQPGSAAAEEPAVPQICPETQVGRRPRGSSCTEGLAWWPRTATPRRGGAQGACGDTASSRNLKGSEGRRDPSRLLGEDPSAAREVQSGLGSLLQNSLFVPPPQERPAADSFLSRVSPPPPPQSPVKATEVTRPREPAWCPSARPRALLFVSFHRSRAASGWLTGGGDAIAARAAKLWGYEVRAPRYRRRQRGARTQDASLEAGGCLWDPAAAREAR